MQYFFDRNLRCFTKRPLKYLAHWPSFLWIDSHWLHCPVASIGKSALTTRFIQGLFIEGYDPTIEDSFCKIENIDGVGTVCLDILDTAGQDEYSMMRESYMRTGEVFIIGFSLTARNSFDLVESFQKQCCQSKDVEEDSLPMVLVGNKCDLVDDRVVTLTEAKEKAKQFNCVYIEASAFHYHNVRETFHEAARVCMNQRKKNLQLRNANITGGRNNRQKRHCTLI
eukprot:Awhi_evm1s2715